MLSEYAQHRGFNLDYARTIHRQILNNLTRLDDNKKGVCLRANALTDVKVRLDIVLGAPSSGLTVRPAMPYDAHR
jgi:hypothetical protein